MDIDERNRDGREIKFHDTVQSDQIGDIVLTAGLLKGKRLGQIMSLANMDELGGLIRGWVKHAEQEAYKKGCADGQIATTSNLKNWELLK